MALTIYDATGYDSFCTIVEADATVAAYTLYNTQWDALTDTQKEIYLRIAFRVIIDGLDEDDYPTAPVDDCVKQAQALIAVQDLITGASALAETGVTGQIKKQQAGVVSVEYFQLDSGSSARTVIIPSLALPCLIDLGWDGSTSVGGFQQTTLGRS